MDVTNVESSVFENIDKIKDIFYFNKDTNKELIETVKLLNESNYQNIQSVAVINEELNKLLDDNEGCNINLLYVNLKDNYDKLQKEYQETKENYDNLKAKVTSEKCENEKIHTEEINKLNEDYSFIALEHEETIYKLRAELEEKETKYLNDIHISQAQAALKYDEMELHFKQLLSDANNKLKQATNMNNNITHELMTLKNTFSVSIDSTEKVNNEKTQELEDRLIFTENQLRIAQEKLFEKSCPRRQVHTSSNRRYSNQSSGRNSYVKVQQNVMVRQADASTSNETSRYTPLPIEVKRTFPMNTSISKDSKKRRLYSPKRLDYIDETSDGFDD